MSTLQYLKSKLDIGILLTFLFLLVLLFLPIISSNRYILYILTVVFIRAIAAQGWNILAGFAGQFSFGHTAFFGIGAYVMILGVKMFGIPPLIGVFVGGILAGLAGVLIGYPAFRLSGPMYSLTTLAFAEILGIIARVWRSVTGGSAGITLPYIKGNSLFHLQFESKVPLYYILLGILIITVIVVIYIQRSMFGLKLNAIREDQDAASSIGIDVNKEKLVASFISGFFVGIAGAFFIPCVFVLDPLIAFAPAQSMQMVLYTIVGGIGTMAGPLYGSFILVPITFFVNSFMGGLGITGASNFLLGLILIIFVTFVPAGLHKYVLKITFFKKRLFVKR